MTTTTTTTTAMTTTNPMIAQRDHHPQVALEDPKLLQQFRLIAFSPLSSRELEVLKLVAEGHSNPTIATSLYLSPNTVKTHVRNIMNKLGVNCRIQIAVMAVRYGLV